MTSAKRQLKLAFQKLECPLFSLLFSLPFSHERHAIVDDTGARWKAELLTAIFSGEGNSVKSA